jgi:hypothetical protein
MDCQFIGTWKITLEVQGSRGSTQRVSPAVASRSTEAIIAQMAGKNPNKSNDNKIKNSDRNHHNSNGGPSSTRHGNTNRGGHIGRERGCGGRGGRGNNSEHLKNVECFNCGKKGHYYTGCSLPRKNNNENSNMFSKVDFKNLFQSSMKDMLTKKDKQGKNNAEGNDDSLDMNVFQKLTEGKQPMFVNKSNDDLISINDTDTFIIYRIKLLTKLVNIIIITMIMMN